MVFNQMIEAIRDEEIREYIMLFLGRALEKGIGNLMSNFSTFAGFLIIYALETESTLTTAKMLATIQLMTSAKLFQAFFGSNFYFELRVIFERFCTILNIKDKRMIQINPLTK